MSLPLSTLQQLSQLAYLEIRQETSEALAEEIDSILDFAQKLNTINTDNIKPLFHPMELSQTLRKDEAIEENYLPSLEAIAPLFEKGFYLVPQVISTEK